MKRLPASIALLTVVSSGITVSTPASAQAEPRRPNILFIMADDHAEQAISAYGSRLIETPNIDRIAHEGVRFENAFVTNSICAPSRAVLLTGKYSHLNGLRDNRDEFDGSQITFPKLLQQAGYQTAIVGKWHLKTTPTGFDHSDVLVGQGHYYRPVFIVDGEEVERPGYATDLITDAAISFLDARDRSRPFALLLHNKAPHRNWMPAIRHLDLYADQDLPLPDTFWDDYDGRPAAVGQDMRVADMYLSMDMKLHRQTIGEETGSGGQASFPALDAWERSFERLDPEEMAAWNAHYDPINEDFAASPPTGDALTEWKFQHYLKDYLRCVAAVDEGVGRVLDYLDAHDLTQDTIVVYTSDQGFYLGEHGWFDKRFMYEESLSMPLLIRYPRAAVAGTVSSEMVLNLDFAQTFLDFAGVAAPPGMQGRSLRPLLEGRPPDDWRSSIYYRYYEFPHGWHDVRPHYGVRTDRYKLIHFQGDLDVWELYDLAEDPHELHNRYRDPDYATVRAKLHRELDRLRDELRDTQP